MPKKKSQSEFLADARKVHGDKYDYSQVVYKGSQVEICIVCKKHGPFLQKPADHLQGKGCPTCSGHKKRTKEEFIAQAKKVHGDKYGFDKVVYVNDRTKVTLTCPIHGDFQITPTSLIHGKHGCKLCAHERIGKQARLTQEEFVKRATEIHHGKYRYDKVVYRDSHTKVIITCPIHGDFEQFAYHHLNGHGCWKCGQEEGGLKGRISLEEFIERAKATHTINYDYSQVELKGLNEPVYIICPDHGGFWQLASTHLNGHNCPRCGYKENSRKRTKSLEKFIEDARRVHGDKYDYSDTVYVNAKQKLAIRCKVHNMVFLQKPNAHLNGNGCPICAQSHLEAEVLRLLRSQGIRFEVEKAFDWLVYRGNMFLDFFLADYSIAIECQGEQHFHVSDYYGGISAFRQTKKRDEKKRLLCEQHGIKVLYFSNLGIHYPYDVIEDPEVLLSAIHSRGLLDNSDLWRTPELPFDFDE